MRVGFFGNTNNLPFQIARALRRLGHDVCFAIDSTEALHRPEHRYTDVALPYPAWIKDFSPWTDWDCVLPSPRRARLRRFLGACDALVVNGVGPALLPLFTAPGVALLTGSDLECYGDFSMIPGRLALLRKRPRRLRRAVVRLLLTRLVNAQRGGLRRAVGVRYFPPGLVPEADRLLESIGVTALRRFTFQVADIKDIPWCEPPHNPVPRVFCATRLSWVRPLAHGAVELDYKGSDVMVRGLGLFARRHGTPLDIRLVDKGLHVAQTRALVEEQGLGGITTWLAEMSQQQVLEEFRRADIVIEQLGESMIGLAGLDAMAVGRPVIGNARPEILVRAGEIPYPVCQASTAEEVCANLARLAADPVERERAGRAGRAFVERECSPERAARLCLERLGATADHGLP